MIHKRTHSVMFHHFHNDKHLPTQGSISGSKFRDMIDWLNKNYNLLNASEYQSKLKNKTLVKMIFVYLSMMLSSVNLILHYQS